MINLIKIHDSLFDVQKELNAKIENVWQNSSGDCLTENELSLVDEMQEEADTINEVLDLLYEFCQKD